MLQSILFLLVIVTVIFLRTKLRDTPLARLNATQQSLIALGVLVFLLLALTGKLGILVPIFGAVTAAFIALISRMMPIITSLFARQLPEWLDRIKGRTEGQGQTHASGNQSFSARSAYLDMTLSHLNGQLDGTILQGPHEGKTLSTLSMQSLMDLYSFYSRDDRESAKLLAAYIEQTFGQQWQRTADSAKASPNSHVDREEALNILGLESDASEDDIIAAHRRLIQKVHPDRGGSDYLASRINQAKDLLLGRRHP